jgi:hypothetical protein
MSAPRLSGTNDLAQAFREKISGAAVWAASWSVVGLEHHDATPEKRD